MLIPRKHQEKALYNIFQHEYGLLKNNRTQLIMACGTGKTLTSLWILEESLKYFTNKSNKGSINIILFPSLYLINQTYKVYEAHTKIKGYKPLVVCSDKKIVENIDSFEINKDEVNYPVTTTIEDITKYLQDESIEDKVIFITYQSSHLLGKSLKQLKLKATFSIFDEAHKVAIINNNKNDSISTALHDNLFPCEKRLFMTATPKHIFFKTDKDKEDKQIVAFSMENEKLFGKISYEYSMREAIDDKIITDYQILGILIDEEYIKRFKRANARENIKTLKEIVNEEDIKSAKYKAIEQTMKKFNINKALVFHSTIDDSKEYEQMSRDKKHTALEVKHIDGLTSHEMRNKIMQDLEIKDKYVVSNSKLLTEGVDVPKVDLIAIMKNMSSKTDIVQTVGRVQRIDENNPNKIGYILLPIFINSLEMSEDEISMNKELRNLFDIINSLKENDKQLRNYIAIKKQKITRAKTENKPYNIIYVNKINDEFIENTFKQKLDEFNDKVNAIILSKRIQTKEDYINATLDFISKFGYNNLKKNTTHIYNDVEYNIGSWRGNQKVKYNKLTSK